jgi:hypothetical protein
LDRAPAGLEGARPLHATPAVPPYTVPARSVAWSPQHDVARERTTPAPLQLPHGSLLLLDETVMATGRLNARGVHSLQVRPATATRM